MSDRVELSGGDDGTTPGPPALRVRPYALTGGRTRPQYDLALEALVRSSVRGLSLAGRLALERRDIVELCASPIAVAEVAARLDLPVGVVRVLVGDMAAEGIVEVFAGAQVAAGARPDVRLLERVLDGLQAL